MEALLRSLKTAYPELRFAASTSFYWSPATQEVHYIASDNSPAAPWSLLHETAHALLQHTGYTLDFELLAMEVAAWEEAKKLARRFGIQIDKEHVENCLDSYRDWLHTRSICPSCGTQSPQLDSGTKYRCFNCHDSWHVTPSRFCRTYRQKASSQAKTPAVL